MYDTNQLKYVIYSFRIKHHYYKLKLVITYLFLLYHLQSVHNYNFLMKILFMFFYYSLFPQQYAFESFAITQV
jgi:hypothetical protein